MREELRIAPSRGVASNVPRNERRPEGHPRLESHVDDFDGGLRRRQRVYCVREFRAIAKEVLTVEAVLSHEMGKALYAEPLLRFHSSDIEKKSLKLGDDCKVSMLIEHLDAPLVVFL